MNGGVEDVSALLPVAAEEEAVLITPMLQLKRILPPQSAEVYLKAEFMHRGGSIKDRIARYMIEKAEARGDLFPGMTILEVTSGNTGIALAMIGAERGYRVEVLMPRSVSFERRKMIRAFGAKVRLIDTVLRIHQARELAEERAAQDPSIFLPRQFSNPDNPEAHAQTTGPEILTQMNGDIDAFVMGVGTGGTLMGVQRAFRHAGWATEYIAVEPAESAVMSGESAGCHGIQGLADGFIPEIVQLDKIDRVIKVRTQDAIEMSQRLAKEEGLFVGISSGANVVGAVKLAAELGPGKKIVTVLPDRGDRYLSTWSMRGGDARFSLAVCGVFARIVNT
jgi:cysteine synthase A